MAQAFEGIREGRLVKTLNAPPIFFNLAAEIAGPNNMPIFFGGVAGPCREGWIEMTRAGPVLKFGTGF